MADGGFRTFEFLQILGDQAAGLAKRLLKSLLPLILSVSTNQSVFRIFRRLFRCSGRYRDRKMGGILTRVKNVLRPENPRPSLEDVRHELLRIAVDHREPAALHLYHDPVSFEERMVMRTDAEDEFCYSPWYERLRFFKALVIPSSHHLAGNHELISTHARVLRILLRIDVNQFDDPVAVAS